MSQFLMPSLGADMDAGTLVEQTIASGAPVKRGDVIGAVETQKGVIEIEVFEDGILGEWLVELGTKVDVGSPLANIVTEGDPPEIPQDPEPQPAPAPPEVPPPEPAPPDISPPVDPTPQPIPPEMPQPVDRARITPAARRYASQHGIDLAKLAGKTVTLSDLAEMPVLAPKDTQNDMRAAIAASMSRSKREIPHYYLSQDVDLTDADAFVTATNIDRLPETRLILAAVIGVAIAKALVKFPEFNGHYSDGQFRPSEAVNLGFAINLRGGGLVAPALFDADHKRLDDFMQDLRDLIARVKSGRFKARELSDATMTLTSLGDRGVDRIFGVIYPPQVAIIGVGTPRKQPAIVDGQVVPRLCATITLSADHRVSDGHRGALFLRAIAKNLGRPETL